MDCDDLLVLRRPRALHSYIAFVRTGEMGCGDPMGGGDPMSGGDPKSGADPMGACACFESFSTLRS